MNAVTVLTCEELVSSVLDLLHSNGSLNNWLKSGGIEWFLEKRGSRKIVSRSRNLRSVCDGPRNLVFG